MRNKWTVVIIVALVAALWAPAAFAMNNTVRGYVKGTDGKPMVGVNVVWFNTDNGRKIVIKTDKSGNYTSIAVPTGKYKITLEDADNKPLFPSFSLTTVVSLQNDETVVDIDLQKEAARGVSEEQKKQNEAIEKENLNIKGLNAALTQAKTQQDAGDFEGAVKTLEQAAQAGPKYDLVWFRLGDAYLAAGKKNTDRAAAKDEFTKAVDSFKKAIEIKGTEGAYFNNMGEAYVRLGETDSAIKAYNDAAAVQPANAAQYYFNMGAVLTNSGKADEANTAFDKAIAADPTRADAYYQKAINLMSKGTVDAKGETHYPPEVAAGLQKYLELAPTGVNADGAKALLTSMGEKVQTSFGPQKTKKK